MKFRTMVWATIASCIMLFAALPAFGRILVIHSYHQEYDWVQGINEGLASILSSGQDLRFFYMDTKRRPDMKSKLSAAREAKKRIKEYKPEVVIAVDDNAQAHVVREYVGSSPIQFVFCGVNEDPDKYNYPSANITGILERAYTKQVLQMLKKVKPEISNIVWISDDSPTAYGVLPRVRKLSESKALPLNITEYIRLATFDRWKKTIATYEKDAQVHAYLIPLYHTIKNRGGHNSVLPSKVMQWTVENTTKPIIGFWPFSTDDGALCAVVVDPFEHGKVAALMAKRILSGKKASEIPLVTNKNGYVIINLKTADRLGIDIPFEVIQSADRIIE